MAEFEPYSFKLMGHFSDSNGENPADGQNELARRGNTSWCNCEHCKNWKNQQERENEMIHSLFWFIPCIFAYENPAICFPIAIAAFLLYGLGLEDDPPICCISRHPDLETVCLQREVMEMWTQSVRNRRGSASFGANFLSFLCLHYGSLNGGPTSCECHELFSSQNTLRKEKYRQIVQFLLKTNYLLCCNTTITSL